MDYCQLQSCFSTFQHFHEYFALGKPWPKNQSFPSISPREINFETLKCMLRTNQIRFTLIQCNLVQITSLYRYLPGNYVVYSLLKSELSYVSWILKNPKQVSRYGYTCQIQTVKISLYAEICVLIMKNSTLFWITETFGVSSDSVSSINLISSWSLIE